MELNGEEGALLGSEESGEEDIVSAMLAEREGAGGRRKVRERRDVNALLAGRSHAGFVSKRRQ